MVDGKFKIGIEFITNEMIEKQAFQDILNFQKKKNIKIIFPLYPDEIIEELWGCEVQYVENPIGGEDTIACYIPEKNIVQVNSERRGVEGRVSFSLAHEAGHISLHKFLLNSGTKIDTNTLNKMERQADLYASAILMPKDILLSQVKKTDYEEKGYLDLKLYGQVLKDFFGVSSQSLEIRLSNLGIKCINGYYKNQTKHTSSNYFNDMEKNRESWSFGRT